MYAGPRRADGAGDVGLAATADRVGDPLIKLMGSAQVARPAAPKAVRANSRLERCTALRDDSAACRAIRSALCCSSCAAGRCRLWLGCALRRRFHRSLAVVNKRGVCSAGAFGLLGRRLGGVGGAPQRFLHQARQVGLARLGLLQQPGGKLVRLRGLQQRELQVQWQSRFAGRCIGRPVGTTIQGRRWPFSNSRSNSSGSIALKTCSTKTVRGPTPSAPGESHSTAR